MARGIQIPFTLDVRQWRKGIKTVELDIEDLGDEFKDLERDADRATDDIEDAFKDIGRGAEKAADDIKAMDGAFDKAKRGAQGLEREMDDVESEANQSAKEFGASFRGDPVEALEEVQGYLAEIVSVKLPGFVGALAGIAGGAALGLIVNQVTEWRERQEEIRQNAQDIRNALLEVGNVLDQNVRKEQEAKFWQELSNKEYTQLLTNAGKLGLTQADINRLIQQGKGDWKDVKDAAGDTWQYTDELYEAARGVSRAINDQATAWGEANRALELGALATVKALRTELQNLPNVTRQVTINEVYGGRISSVTGQGGLVL